MALKYGVDGVVSVIKATRITMSYYAITAKKTLQITSLDTQGYSMKGRQEPVETLEEVIKKTG